MKKKLVYLVLLGLFLFTACSSKSDEENNSGKKVITVTTSFIEDMVKNLISENEVEINTVIPAGEDAHVYTAKPEDLSKIQNNDLLLYHGLNFESKMLEFLTEKGKSITKNFDKKDIQQLSNEGHIEVDPHFWFNIELYKTAFNEVKTYLLEIMPDKNDIIQKNYEEYIKKLGDLHGYVVKRLNEIPRESRYLITPHDAFGYFSKVYGIEVKSPQGVNTGTEISNKDIEDTANFIVKNKVKAIFIERTNNPDKMKKLKEIVKSKGFDVTIVSGKDKELYADALAPKGERGDTFLEMYKNNIDLIVDNLK